MSSRRRVNTITTIQVEGVSVEGVHNVREAVFTHFSNHFKARNVVRPTALNLNFQTISVREGAEITKPFSMDELKNAVWDCDSYKCLGPDGVNFGFIKDF